MTMTSNVSSIDAGPRVVNLAIIVDAARAHLHLWQQNSLGDLPQLQSNLNRHQQLMGNFLDQLIQSAQRLEAHLAPRMLGSVIQLWTPEIGAELRQVVDEETKAVAALLDAQISYLDSESQAIASLPALNGVADRARLRAKLTSNAEHTDIRSETAERLEADLHTALRALEVLETSGLYLYFEGRVPTNETLVQVMAAKTVELRAPATLIAQALIDLEMALQAKITGLSHAELVDQIDLLITRVGEERRHLRKLAQQEAALIAILTALDHLEPLALQRCRWQGAVARLLHALRSQANLLQGSPSLTLVDAMRVDEVCGALLQFQRHILGQLVS